MNKKVKEVRAEVVSQKGTCELGHGAGDVVRFTDHGVEGRICIHALYSMMPAAFAMLFDVEFPWLPDKDVKTHPCTDAATPVVFELKKLREP